MPEVAAPKLEWGATARSRSSTASSGDLAVVTRVPAGAVIAAVDGLGHGAPAAHAACAAAAVVRRSAGGDLVSLVRDCHAVLRETRGAAMSIAFLSAAESTLTWIGIGNVQGWLVAMAPSASSVKSSLPLLSGVLGQQLPTLTTTTLKVRRGDVLIFATDGVATAFVDSLDLIGTPKDIADRILADYGRAGDVALALVVRYLGRR